MYLVTTDRLLLNISTLQYYAYAIYSDFTAVKKRKFLGFFLYFSYFCSKHGLWVHVRTASLRRF